MVPMLRPEFSVESILYFVEGSISAKTDMGERTKPIEMQKDVKIALQNIYKKFNDIYLLYYLRPTASKAACSAENILLERSILKSLAD